MGDGRNRLFDKMQAPVCNPAYSLLLAVGSHPVDKRRVIHCRPHTSSSSLTAGDNGVPAPVPALVVAPQIFPVPMVAARVPPMA
eukprot:IDg3457t1